METLRDRTPSTRRLIAAIAFACSLVLVGCGGDDDEGTDAAVQGVEDQDDRSTEGGGDDPAGSADEGDGSDDALPGGSSTGGSGTLVLGDQTVELEVQCMLAPQEAAAGGGQILFVGQGTGVDAEGQNVLLDVSRYDEDSQFAGDAVSVEIGDYMAGESTSLESRTPIGTVEVEGSTMRAEVTLQDFTDGSDVAASFELNC